MRKNHRLLGKIGKTKILSKLSKTTSFRCEVGNRDINIVEQSNIPKFSKLDDTETPLRLFETFLHDVLVDMIAGYTKLYGLREKADTNLENF